MKKVVMIVVDSAAVHLTLTCPIFPGLFAHADRQHCQ